MELGKALAKRLIAKTYGYRLSPAAVTLEHSPSTHSREYITSLELSERGFFRKFLQRRGINQSAARIPEFLSLPVGDKLREKLKGINIAGDRLRLEGLGGHTVSDSSVKDIPYGFTVQDARKLLRLSQVEKLKMKLREIPKSSISYHDFVRICVEFCGNEDQGTEFSKLLDDSGNVIVLGNIVFLRPEQVRSFFFPIWAHLDFSSYLETSLML